MRVYQICQPSGQVIIEEIDRVYNSTVDGWFSHGRFGHGYCCYSHALLYVLATVIFKVYILAILYKQQKHEIIQFILHSLLITYQILGWLPRRLWLIPRIIYGIDFSHQTDLGRDDAAASSSWLSLQSSPQIIFLKQIPLYPNLSFLFSDIVLTPP